MTIKELHDNLYNDESPRDQRNLINSYESNVDLINNVDLSNLEDYDYAMRLTCDYSIALVDLGYIKKGISYCDKAINLIENFPGFNKDKLFDIRYYELVLFNKAKALYKLKKYKESSLIFETLNKNFPQNDYYISWIYGLKNRKYDLISKIGYYVMLISIILNILFNKTSPNIYIYIYFLLIFSLSFTVIFEIIKRIKLYKSKQLNKKIYPK